MGKKQDQYMGSASGMNITDHISESLETNFFVFKILKFFDVDPESFLTLDPGWKNSDPGSGINIPDPGSGINIPDPQHRIPDLDSKEIFKDPEHLRSIS
jgi:hypothetical protein